LVRAYDPSHSNTHKPPHDNNQQPTHQIVSETLPALNALKREGVVRAVGITGLPLKAFQYVLDRAEPGER
jgi:L-galactose dehydrogenase